MVKEEIKYKETGIVWVPTIPSHWVMRRIKTLFTFRKEIVGEDSTQYKVLSLTVQGDGIIERDIESGMGKFPATFDGYQKIEPNSIVLCLFDMDVTPRIVGFSELSGMISAAYTNIVPKENVYTKFYYYYFLNQDRDKSLYALGKGIRITLREDSFGSLFAPYPSYEEQKAIVEYLDSQIEKINLFIQKKQRFIELLKEQKSTIVKSKFSNTNKNWKRRKISHSFKIIGSGTTPDSGNSDYYDGGEINWINTGDLNDGYLDNCEKRITQLAFEKFSTLKIYPKGTLLIALYGATIGKVSILNIEGCTNQACCAVFGSETFYTEFLFHWFIANRDILIQMSYGGGQPNISQEIIRQLRILCPPIEEQKQIVSHIKTETATIDTAISKAEREIELIREYKEAMISEAVMGKKIN